MKMDENDWKNVVKEAEETLRNAVITVEIFEATIRNAKKKLRMMTERVEKNDKRL